MTPTRPVLRYHGGKWRVAEWVISHFPPHHAYVEAFGGAGSVLLRKPVSPIEVYNDVDGALVSLFRVLRDPVQSAQLQRALELTPWSRAEFSACWGPDTGDAVEDARRLVVRTGQSIGAKRRESRNGWRARVSHVTPTDAWRRWPEQLPLYLDRLRGVLIEQLSWEKVLDLYDGASTLFYLDPPYLHSTRAWDHRSIYAHELSVADHVALLERVQGLSGMVLLSGYRSALYDDALAGWQRAEVRARAQGNQPRVETLWLNPAAAAAVRQSPLALAAC